MSKIDALRTQLDELLEKADSSDELEKAKVALLGKKGKLTELMSSLRELRDAQEKKTAGQLINQLKKEVEDRLAKKAAELEALEERRQIEAGPVYDFTTPAQSGAGSLHPITIVQRELEEIFASMGFTIEDYNEIVGEYQNFEAVNIPKYHPARDMQDTFYINYRVVLRTHTSPCEARALMTIKPPFRLVIPGRVFRVDEVDASHSPVFMQMEGLVVDKNISMADLKGTLDEFVHAVFGEDVRTRFRPSYFPFTEPSAEVDISCTICGGKGCRVCKGTGWIEVLGCGVTNPHELENCGLDPHEWSAFAFGIGVDRVTSLKYGITDIRLEYENDARFLGQF